MNKDSLLNIASFSPKSIQFPNSWVGHLPFAAWVIQQISPKIFVELGTHSGNSYFSFCQSVKESGISTQCYAVDTWQGDEHAGQYGDEIFSNINAFNKEHYEAFSQLLRMTFDDAVNNFADESIELLHIDGLHTYEAVRHDFETWLPKLAPGAVVMFHDTNVTERNFGVWKLWQELQARYPNSLEFVHSHGLGVLQINNATNNKKMEWLQQNSPEKQKLIDYFAALGNWQLERFALTELKQTLIEREVQVVNLNQILIEREGQIASLYNSNSWRITQPLRVMAQKVRYIQLIFNLISLGIKRRGGFKNTWMSAIQLFQSEGLKGVRHILQKVTLHTQSKPTSSFGKSDRNDYEEWIFRYDTLTDETRGLMRKRINTFANKPLISVVMPCYNPKPEWLIAAIESVRTQIYPNWELCIADDASSKKAIRPILERYAKEDSRIKVVFREVNGHISAASNSALELVEGEWVALLDHDDLLSEHALFWVVDAINRNSDIRLIYSDEDKVDEIGRRFNPYFKCDWNLDLFYSQNLVTHLALYRTDVLKKIGGFSIGLEGAQDHDLALRCVERIHPNQIHHIPRVLYHWRAHKKSTAQAANVKPYALLAGERALNEHFQRQNLAAKAEILGQWYRVRYSLPDNPPLVSLIIPTRNGLQLIQQCVDSILAKTTYSNYEILIIDNGSDDSATLQYFGELQAEARVRVLRDERPFNYSALNNSAAKLARGDILGLLNNDLEIISPDWLSEMVSIALQPGIGAVGARLWYPNNTLQHGGVILGLGGVAGHAHKNLAQLYKGHMGRASLLQSFSAVTAACLVIQKDIYEEVGGLNEKDLQVAFNDVDFCLRVKEAGYRNIWTPYAELYHYESATRGYEDTPEKLKRFQSEVQYMQKRWGETLMNDPAYSPNLTLDREDFSLAWPPRVEFLAS